MNIKVFLCYIMFESFAVLAFYLLNKTLNNEKLSSIDAIKGIVERLIIVIGTVNNFPQVIIAIFALKVSARLHLGKQNKEISNDFYVLGNLLSLLIALLTSVLILKFLG